MVNILVILFQLYFSIPISPTDPFWIFTFILYIVAFLLQLLIIYFSFNEPGFYIIAENEIKNFYSERTIDKFISAIEFILLIYVGLTNVLAAYTLFLGTFYLVKHFLFSDEKS